MLTDYHAKLIAHDLTRRCPSDSMEKLMAVLSDAQVDLNPHQIDAALFAFCNPLSRGAILSDKVGLGKTIKAGLFIARVWAKRKIRSLEAKYDDALPADKQTGREIDRQKESLLDEIADRLEQKTACSELFTVRWRVV